MKIMSEYQEAKVFIERIIPEIYELSPFNADIIEEYIQAADAEITRLVDSLSDSSIRNKALEEAAKVAEEYKGYTHNDGETICDNLFSLADEIRQLKTKE